MIQFWDKTHLVAGRLGGAGKTPQPQPECCEDDGVLWDVAAVFEKDTRWSESVPRAVYMNGPVARVTVEISAALLQQLGR